MALDEQLRRLADRVPPPPAGDPQAAFRQGQRRRKRRRTSVASGLVLAVLGVVVLTQTVTGPRLVIDPTAPGDASVLAVPEPGAADPAHLEDGTAVFVSHLADGEVIVLDATSPDNQSLLAFCERGGGLEDPRHGSSFTADGTWIGGPSPTGLATYPYERVGNDQIRVTGPAGPAPPRPEADSVSPGQIPHPFCFDTETGDHPDRARYHQPDQQPSSRAPELSRERWQWIRADLEVRDGTVLLCETAPCGADVLEVPAPYDNWVRIFRQDGHDRLLLARLNEDGTVDVRLPAVETSSFDPTHERCVQGWNEAFADGELQLEVAADLASVATQDEDEWEGRYPVCWIKMLEDGGPCQAFHADRRTMEWRSDPVSTCTPDLLPEGAELFAVDGHIRDSIGPAY